jgi:DNA-binding PadR family transcriptional regulator
MAATKPLGTDQIGFLRAMLKGGAQRNAERTWSQGCGWTWGTPSQTQRVADSLVRRGLLQTTSRGNRSDVYSLTDAGRQIAKEA